MVNPSTILITGATGFIGAQVALAALKDGHSVRLSVRKESQIQTLQKVFSQYHEKLDFIVVPDITVSGAFDNAVKDVDYIIHVASPLANPGQDLLTPAVKGTMSILESAVGEPRVQKVVITASVASLIPLGTGKDGLVITEDIEKQKLLFDPAIVPTLDTMGQYVASKAASYTATLDFVEDKKPHFSVVTFHPVFVFGHSIVQAKAEDLSGTNGMLFGSLFSPEPMFAPYRGVHVQDVADAHIRALSLPERSDKGVEAFLLSGKDRPWTEVLEYVKAKYPGADFKAEPKTGDQWFVNTEKAEKLLGFSAWKEMEDQVDDVLTQQFQLRGLASE